jgi:membrane-bound lytic murein transglycosylase D
MYGEFIRSRLRDRGMPEDLFYLAMIESGLSNRAVSHAAAVGIWQFIAETGRRYGLEVTTYVDERRDPVKATDAALDYLEYLYDRFGSWYLAAAGYNSGRTGWTDPPAASGWRSVATTRCTGDRAYLPRETRDYVPLMLAAGHIGKDPNAYGFYGLEHQAAAVVRPSWRWMAASAWRGGEGGRCGGAAVRELNPHLVRGVTPPGRTWEVRVPVGRRAAVLANLDRAGGRGAGGHGDAPCGVGGRR